MPSSQNSDDWQFSVAALPWDIEKSESGLSMLRVGETIAATDAAAVDMMVQAELRTTCGFKLLLQAFPLDAVVLELLRTQGDMNHAQIEAIPMITTILLSIYSLVNTSHARISDRPRTGCQDFADKGKQHINSQKDKDGKPVSKPENSTMTT